MQGAEYDLNSMADGIFLMASLPDFCPKYLYSEQRKLGWEGRGGHQGLNATVEGSPIKRPDVGRAWKGHYHWTQGGP